MSPTIFREGPFRFFFFSREEPRVHVHVISPDGEAKFWIEPKIELAKGHGFKRQQLTHLATLVAAHEQEIQDAWNEHFGH